MSAGQENNKVEPVSEKPDTEFVALDKDEIDALKKYASGMFFLFRDVNLHRSIHSFMQADRDRDKGDG